MEVQSVVQPVPARAAYWQEFGHGWRPLAAATVGLSVGMALNAYVSSIFAPYLLDAFGWTRSQFALLGALSLITLILMPVVGRLTDLYGVRRVAVVGIVGYPVSLVAFSTMSGDITTFYGLVVAQAVFSLTTTTGVYSRVVAAEYSHARGLALAICASGPALAGALASPLLTLFNEQYGWRAGYQLLALISAGGGILALALLPRGKSTGDAGAAAPVAATAAQRKTRDDYRAIIANPAFLIIFASAVLCSIPHALSHSQVKVMLTEHGVSAVEAGYMVSVFAAGVLIGRFGAGVALDRWPTHLASMLFMGLPSIGLFILASSTTSFGTLALAVALLGLSFGGEADVLAYTTAKYFPIELYSSVLGLLLAAVGCAIGLGSLLLSALLGVSESYRWFMVTAGVSVVIGSLNLLRLARCAARSATGPVPAAFPTLRSQTDR